MTHPTIKQALTQSEDLQNLRTGETLIPTPNYDIALCLYERNPDGTDTEDPFLSIGFRPQDFATNPHMKYTRLAVMQEYESEGKAYIVCFLIHVYWDGTRNEDMMQELILNTPSVLSYGQWQPTAPSDPLREDDFWHDELGTPPNGIWDTYRFGDHEDDEDNNYQPFNNFARKPYEKID